MVPGDIVAMDRKPHLHYQLCHLRPFSEQGRQDRPDTTLGRPFGRFGAKRGS